MSRSSIEAQNPGDAGGGAGAAASGGWWSRGGGDGVIALVGLVLTIVSRPVLDPPDACPLIAGPVAAAIYVALDDDR